MPSSPVTKPPSARTELPNDLAAIQKTFDEIKLQRDPSLPPLTREQSEAELARQLGWPLEKLRATLTAAKAGDNILARSIALLAMGENDQANAGFDQVIAAKAVPTLRSAYDGKASIAYDRVDVRETLTWREKSTALIDKKDAPLEWATAQEGVCYVLLLLADYQRAEPLLREILALREARLPPEHPDIATSLNHLAHIYQATNRLKKAQPLMERALRIAEAAYGKEHPNVAIALNNLALHFLASKRPTEAEPLIERAMHIDETAYGKDHPNIAVALSNLALAYQATDRLEQSEPLNRRALLINLRLTRETSQEPPHLRSIFAVYRKTLWKLGLSETATYSKLLSLGPDAGWNEAQWELKLAELRGAQPAGHSDLFYRTNIASFGIDHGQPDKSRDELSALIREMDEAKIHDPLAASARFDLCRAFAALGQKQEAIAVLREALAIYKKLPADKFPAGRIKESEDLLKTLSSP